MTTRSETFGRLLKGAINSIATYEGKTAPIIEEELAEKVGLASTAIQRYKTGHLPPNPRTIEVIADAAIRRGFLSREWLTRFLHAGRYPAAEHLLDTLCPVGPVRSRPPRIYQNLPAPTYSQFVMRATAFADVIDGLGKRSAAVVIVGLGGNGKTSLAREITGHALGADDTSRFDAAVWVSDKDHPGTTNLSVVLDEIARTLDYPGFTQFAFDEKQREVEQLLRRQRVLICIDNAETITDGALIQWLLNLPEPSKALITTREYRREFRRGGWPVELRGMSELEAQALIEERLRVLRIEKLIAERAQLDPLLVATGGNPKAIEMTLGLVKYERRPLQDIVDDLYAARGELFDDLFTRAWALLDEVARRVLLVMTFFPTSASEEALSATADAQGYTFARTAERLTDMGLLDAQQLDVTSLPRYTLHPLVRAFAAAKLGEQPLLERDARMRWVRHLRTLAQQAEEHWKHEQQAVLRRMEQELLTFHAALLYCANSKDWTSLNELVFLLYNVWSYRGYYEDRRRFIDIALQAAEEEAMLEDQIRLLCVKVRTLCYLDEPETAMGCCQQARTVLSQLVDRAPSLEHNINYSQIRVHFLVNELDEALSLAKLNIAVVPSERWKLIYHYDVAECYYRLGEYQQARELARELITSSEAVHDRRGVQRAALMLSRIAMEMGEIVEARAYLSRAGDLAVSLHHRRLQADVLRVYARFYMLQGDDAAARHSLVEAIDLFERLGMRRSLTEVREELQQLKMGNSGVK